MMTLTRFAFRCSESAFDRRPCSLCEIPSTAKFQV